MSFLLLLDSLTNVLLTVIKCNIDLSKISFYFVQLKTNRYRHTLEEISKTVRKGMIISSSEQNRQHTSNLVVEQETTDNQET